jgi:hypothetical protein
MFVGHENSPETKLNEKLFVLAINRGGMLLFNLKPNLIDGCPSMERLLSKVTNIADELRQNSS